MNQPITGPGSGQKPPPNGGPVAHDGGGPAFPYHYDVGGPYPRYESGSGMTRRDWLAGQTLPQILSRQSHYGDHGFIRPEIAAQWAYEIADAMIAEGAK